MFPQGYGIAYRAFDRNGAICYPMPLNWVVRWWRAFIDWFRFPEGDIGRESQWAEAYQRGQTKEREACAREAESWAYDAATEPLGPVALARSLTATMIAASIRARVKP